MANLNWNDTLSNFTTTEEDASSWSDHVYYRLRIAVTIFVTLLDLAANTLAFVVLPRTNIPSNSKILLMSLFAADFVIAIVALFSIAPAILDEWPYGHFMCQLFGIFGPSFLLVAVWSLMVLNIDRYIAISRPLHHRLVMKRSRLILLIGIGWTFPFLTLITHFISKHPVAYNQERCACHRVMQELRTLNSSEKSFELFEVLFLASVIVTVTLFQIAVLLFTYIRIFLITRAHIRAVQNGTLGQNVVSVKSSDTKILRMLLATTFVFLVTWPPINITNILTIIASYDISEPVVFGLFWLSLSSSWIQVLSLAITSGDFRRTSCHVVKQFFFSLTCSLSQVDTTDNQMSPSSIDLEIRNTSSIALTEMGSPREIAKNCEKLILHM